jgi:hypothetical protein
MFRRAARALADQVSCPISSPHPNPIHYPLALHHQPDPNTYTTPFTSQPSCITDLQVPHTVHHSGEGGGESVRKNQPVAPHLNRTKLPQSDLSHLFRNLVFTGVAGRPRQGLSVSPSLENPPCLAGVSACVFSDLSVHAPLSCHYCQIPDFILVHWQRLAVAVLQEGIRSGLATKVRLKMLLNSYLHLQRASAHFF